PEQRKEIRELSNVELFESGYKLEWMDNPWREVNEGGEWLQELESLTSPDIVHLNGYSHGALPFRAPVVVAGHSCVFSWFEHVKRNSPPQEWEIYRRKVAEGLRGADFVVVPTLSMLSSLRRHYGLQVSYGVIHNGRSSALFKPLTKEKLIFSAGRVWDEGKNIPMVVSCASSFDWPVVVAGDDGGRGDIQGDNVTLLGRISSESVANWMGRASIYLFPAKYEPFGLSVLEAGLCGCALVLGDIESLREVWGDAALYVSPGDRDETADTVKKLIENQALLFSYSQRALNRARIFTAAKMADAYVEIYRGLKYKRETGLCNSPVLKQGVK
ncbi:MAG TPA: glycosyltransferase, partial [Chitinispirillaceae bacterium]|nr:glycosyltransferase [Chitinispirillaceae bacterium]